MKMKFDTTNKIYFLANGFYDPKLNSAYYMIDHKFITLADMVERGSDYIPQCYHELYGMLVMAAAVGDISADESMYLFNASRAIVRG